jgi:peptide/nickel transport system permease protein
MSGVLESATEAFVAAAPAADGAGRRLARNWSVRIGGTVFSVVVLAAAFAPWIGVVDPTFIDAANRDVLPGASGMVSVDSGEPIRHIFWMGADSYGRDIYSRVLYGGRVSLVVGSTVALLSVAFGVAFGIVAGYVRWVDSVLMRLMDGVMAIPGILLALTLVAIWHASLWTVVLAITLTEIPRVVRLVRSAVLSIREEPYIEAAILAGTPTLKILYRHVLPNTIAPLVVQGTYVFAFAMMVEASLSFLGVGLPADLPTWGNMMAEGRLQFIQYPHAVLFPGLVLACTVLSVNMLGDGLRDTLDPRFSKRGDPR